MCAARLFFVDMENLMALTAIVSDAEVQLEIGESLTGDDLSRMQGIKNRVEALVRKYCRWSITTATYTHFLPGIAPTGYQLLLPEPYVTSVTSVYEDWNATGGQGASDFSSDTLLTAGTDYYLDYDSSAMSKTGILIRKYREWPPYTRTVKVTYVSGLDATALANEYVYVKEAILREVIDRYQYSKERSGNVGSVGPVEMERLKDYTVKYGSSTNTISRISLGSSGLFEETEALLDTLVNYGTFM